MAETKYSRHQIIKFFRALDDLLTDPMSITVIGGTAMILGYKIDRGTIDVDSWMKPTAAMQKNWKEAAARSGVNVRLDLAGVAQAPESFEERLITLKSPKFKKIAIRFPEAHDLVIMKICRNMDIDIEDMDALHEKVGLDADTLLKRYLNDFVYVGSQKDIDLKYLATVERLFGDDLAAKHHQAIEKRS